MSRLPKLPKIPRGLKKRARRAEALAKRRKEIDARLREIERLRKLASK